MNYSEFITAVEQHLTVDADRQASSSLKNRLILDAIWDLQFYIEPYRQPGKSLIHFESFAPYLGSQSVVFEGPKRILHVYLCFRREGGFDPSDILARLTAKKVPISMKHHLLQGDLTVVTTCDEGYEKIEGVYWLYDFNEQRIHVSPGLILNQSLEVVWDSYRYAFGPTDSMIWFPDAAYAVSTYVKAHILREIHEDETGYRSYLGTYFDLRTNLFLQAKEMYDGESCDTQTYYQGGYVRPALDAFVADPRITLFDNFGTPITFG